MLQDPKFEFRDGHLWHTEGGYVVPTDEPLVIFRGKDQGTLVAMEAYRAWLQRQDEHQGIVAAHVDSISERISAIAEWQSEHPDRVGMGCHTCVGHLPHRVRA